MSPPTDLRQQKRDLRQQMELRRAEAAATNTGAADALADVFLRSVELPPAAIVAAYFPRGSEMNVTPLADALRGRGFGIALPVVVKPNAPLLFRLFLAGDALRPGAMNIPEPLASAKAVEPDVLLVPLLAFDRSCYRLGYGGGYYDRTLRQYREYKPVTAIGIAFECQGIDRVPVGHHDARLDGVVTEKAFYRP